MLATTMMEEEHARSSHDDPPHVRPSRAHARRNSSALSNGSDCDVHAESGSAEPAGAEVVTDSMVKEEEQLHAESRKEEESIRVAVQDQYDAMLAQQRMQRLNFLLDRTKLFSEFLLAKMQRQQQEAKTKEERTLEREARKAAQQATQASPERVSERRETRSGLTREQREPGDEEEKQPNHAAKAKKSGGGRLISDYFGQEPKTAPPTTPAADPAGDGAADMQRPIVDGRPISDRQPLLMRGGHLRPYQLAGVEWLASLYENGLNGILADEMGLGKTAQCIAFVAHLVEKGVPGPYLVCAPLSTLPNWVAEFERFCPDLPVILYHGLPQDREDKRRLFRNAKTIAVGLEGAGRGGVIATLPIVVTSYEIVMRDCKYLANVPWKYIFVDEGHRIKNLNCRLIRELKTYRSANRLLLTGTPLQNNLKELWSLLNFLLPDIFDDLDSFQQWFDFSDVGDAEGNRRFLEENQEKQVLQKLHQILQPFLLRRLKSDVEQFLPRKREITVYAPLTPLQQKYYAATLDGSIAHMFEQRDEDRETTSSEGRRRRGAAEVDGAEADGARGKDQLTHIRMMNVVMQLRRVCNHPYLLSYPLADDGEYRMDEGLVTTCGKMLVLDRLLPALRAQGHKVLIFSQFTTMLDILQDYCYVRKIPCVRLDGATKWDERQLAINAFNTDPGVFIFLLSTRAGGLGINLTGADTCVLYDSDWNPQVDLQAMDRCHRIGQTKPVVVYRLCTAGTVEQRILERATAKRKVEKMVIHRDRFRNPRELTAALKSEELADLLAASEADALWRSAPEAAGRQLSPEQVISDADLEALLARSDDEVDDHDHGDHATKKRAHKRAKTVSREAAGEATFRVLTAEEQRQRAEGALGAIM